MDRRMAADLDRYITGNYGEDQFRDEDELSWICPECAAENLGNGSCVTEGCTVTYEEITKNPK